VSGAETVIHCATIGGKDDVPATHRLVQAATRASRPHLIYISITGVDRVPLSYYGTKLACEQLIMDSSLPWTILRTTQFHDLISQFWSVLSRLPIMLVPAFSFQPIDASEVAARLADLAIAGPSGRVPDIGGPQVRQAADLASAYLRQYGRQRRIMPVALPGATYAAYRTGAHLAREHAIGTITYEEFLRAPRT
jgi:uncharacterized protein YbjT (DUF2867 family)